MARRRVTGDARLKSVLSSLRDVPVRREVDDAIVDGLAPLVEETEARATRPSLKSGVGVAKARTSSRVIREFLVGFRRGMAMRIAHLVEFGTAPHSMAKGASRRKNLLQDRPPFSPGTPAEPFFRPAFDSTKDEIIRKTGANLWSVIARTAGRR